VGRKHLVSLSALGKATLGINFDQLDAAGGRRIDKTQPSQPSHATVTHGRTPLLPLLSVFA
jgi:hypothetical protein